MHADPGPVELRAAEKNRIKKQQSEQSAALHYVHIRLTPVCRAISSTRQSPSVTLLHHITARFTCSRALNRCLQMDLRRLAAGCFTPGGSALVWGGRVKQEDPPAACLEWDRSCLRVRFLRVLKPRSWSSVITVWRCRATKRGTSSF